MALATSSAQTLKQGKASHVNSPPPSRPPSAPVPPLPSSSSTVSLPRLYPPYGSTSLHFSSMINLSCEPQRATPLDSRRARRQCTDFGFSRAPPPPPLSLSLSDSGAHPKPDAPGIYSPSSESTPTPSSTFSSSGSDSEVSSLEDMRFEFPEPPPISPVLRRMKSTPLFIMDDMSTGQLTRRGFHDHTPDLAHQDEHDEAFYDPRSDTTVSPLSQTSSADSPDTPSHDLELDSQGEQLILESANWLLPAHLESSFPGSSSNAYNDSHSTVLPSPCRATTFPQNAVSPRSPPSISYPHQHRRVSKMRSLKFSPSCSESVERLDTFAEKMKGQKSIVRGRAVSMDFKSYRTSFFSSAAEKTAARMRPASQATQNSDLQTPKKFVSTAPSSGHAKSLSLQNTGHSAFLVTPTRPPKRPLSTVPGHSFGASSASRAEEYRSFMDISPEREGRRLGHGKDKMKKLLARASTLFDWGKLRKTGK
ncbi:hypothetical protein AAF712_013984 [Marasmius tenuissimus]|uniref:Uncharacterized protein n=1 Tax=Marasmius tenuissimus TaxID=585030 RepID=A0ABR2ZED6_9AGAR|nr:hypothetical protein PM082_001545 [Marasmius tenuissimus]